VYSILSCSASMKVIAVDSLWWTRGGTSDPASCQATMIGVTARVTATRKSFALAGCVLVTTGTTPAAGSSGCGIATL
jgi:hypothetical protein